MSLAPVPLERRRPPGPVPGSALVVGFARTGRAVAQALRARGASVAVVDDRPAAGAAALADELGATFLAAPAQHDLARLAGTAELVVVSPGVAPTHPIYSIVPGERLVSEIELAYRLSPVPIVAITGTNGKTTVTGLVAAMLCASGLHARSCGNIGDPLVEVVADESLEVAVAEVSSFQLAYTDTFRPVVATWLNLAEDHLDWHPSHEHYAAAKGRIYANLRPDDVAVANATDETVLSYARRSAGRLVTFGSGGDYRRLGGVLVGPGEEELAGVGELARAMPHDVDNALAALASARAAGAGTEACRAALARFSVPPHRVELVARVSGVGYYDDSKATTPSAVAAALSGFASVVLIAGGRNKGLDLSAIRRAAEVGPCASLRAVVAIGEAADEVEAAFSPQYRVVRAASMHEAVRRAAELASAGDAVLLSPGCASFDWYRSYAERGEDFKRAVTELARAGAR